MQHIDPTTLATLSARTAYAKAFVGFTPADAAALHAAQPAVTALIPTVVDAVYTKLLSFDITAQAFVPRQTGYEGEAPASLHDLSLEHPQIKFRMGFLKGYLLKLVTMDYDLPSTWEYLDKVALMHTGVAGFAHRAKRPGLRVEYEHMASSSLRDRRAPRRSSRAPRPGRQDKVRRAARIQKVLWIQNDLFARHYIPSEDPKAAGGGKNALGAGARGVLFGVATVVVAGVLQVLYQRVLR